MYPRIVAFVKVHDEVTFNSVKAFEFFLLTYKIS